MKVEYLSVDRLTVGGFNVRDRYLEEGIVDLKASISEHGVCVPLAVVRQGESFAVLDGGRRLFCARELGLDHVPCVVFACAQEKAPSLAWVLNFQREAVSFIDEAAWLARLAGEACLSVDEIGVLLGRSSAYIRARLSVNAWPDLLLVYCQSAAVSFSVAREYARLGASVELERALDWDRVNHASYRQAVAYVDAILLARETVVTPAVVAAASKAAVPVCGACGGEVDWNTAKNLLVCGECLAALGSVVDAASAEGVER